MDTDIYPQSQADSHDYLNELRRQGEQRRALAEKVSEATDGKYEADTIVSPGPGPDRSGMNRAQRRQADREHGPVSPTVDRFGPSIDDGLQAE